MDRLAAGARPARRLLRHLRLPAPDARAPRPAAAPAPHRARGDAPRPPRPAPAPRSLPPPGQLHKGGPNPGVFLQLTADEGEDLPIPEEPYGFGALRWAQAAGDFEVLAKRARGVMPLPPDSPIG